MPDWHLSDNFVPVEINKVAMVWLLKLFWKSTISLSCYTWIWNICNSGRSRTSPEKACPLSRCSEPWPSSLPKCSRISSRRWLYVIGPPEIFTKCSLSNRKETWRPVLYIVPPTWKTTSFYERQWSKTPKRIQRLETDSCTEKLLPAKHIFNCCCYVPS